jgi:hypothetical protein
MAQEWYVQIGEKVFGPHPPAKLREGAKTGRLLPETLVRRGKEGPWIEASNLEGLFRNCRTDKPPQTEADQPDSWFYRFLGETVGPVSTEEMMDAWEQGILTEESDVNRVEDGKEVGWAIVASAPEFIELFSSREPKSNPTPVAVELPARVRRQTPQYSGGLGFHVEAQLVEPLSSKLLKQATAKKKEGDLDGAVDMLRQAYQQIDREPVEHTTTTYLRLPKYLQSAGRNDEAWAEFNRLLVEGHPSQKRDPISLPGDHSQIYDAMRLFLQREKRPDRAIRSGIMSFLYGYVSLHNWSRSREESAEYRIELREQFREGTTRQEIENMLSKLLKKAKCEEKLPTLTAIVQRAVKQIPNFDITVVVNEINAVVADDSA